MKVGGSRRPRSGEGKTRVWWGDLTRQSDRPTVPTDRLNYLNKVVSAKGDPLSKERVERGASGTSYQTQNCPRKVPVLDYCVTTVLKTSTCVQSPLLVKLHPGKGRQWFRSIIRGAQLVEVHGL